MKGAKGRKRNEGSGTKGARKKEHERFIWSKRIYFDYLNMKEMRRRQYDVC
jgi:hypothetical protein